MKVIYGIVYAAVFTLLTAIPVFAQDEATLESNKALVEQYGEALASGDLATLESIIAPDYINHSIPENQRQGLQDALTFASGFHAAFPDAQIQVQDIIAEGDRVTVRYITNATHSGPFVMISAFGTPLVLPPTGNRVSFSGNDIFRVVDGKISEIWGMSDTLSLMRQLYAPKPAEAPVNPLPAEEVALYEPGAFLESVVVDAEGNLYLTNIRQGQPGQIIKLTPEGESTVFVEMSDGSNDGFGVLALSSDDQSLYATTFVGGQDSQGPGLWRFSPDGTGERFASFPQGALPNGVTAGSEGHLLVADSLLGVIWQVDAVTGEVSEWLKHPLLAPRPVIGVYPGANGIQTWNGDVYVAVSDSTNILRIPVNEDGSAGNPVIHATGVPTDDFTIDRAGSIYATTHVFNTVVKIAPDGSLEVVATAEEGVIGPTSTAFGRREGDETSLYVVNDGGLFGMQIGAYSGELRPNVVRLTVSDN
jgi:predicted ester cyclase